jgi:hypothetical protein
MIDELFSALVNDISLSLLDVKSSEDITEILNPYVEKGLVENYAYEFEAEEKYLKVILDFESLPSYSVVIKEGKFL